MSTLKEILESVEIPEGLFEDGINPVLKDFLIDDYKVELTAELERMRPKKKPAWRESKVKKFIKQKLSPRKKKKKKKKKPKEPTGGEEKIESPRKKKKKKKKKPKEGAAEPTGATGAAEGEPVRRRKKKKKKKKKPVDTPEETVDILDISDNTEENLFVGPEWKGSIDQIFNVRKIKGTDTTPWYTKAFYGALYGPNQNGVLGTDRMAWYTQALYGPIQNGVLAEITYRTCRQGSEQDYEWSKTFKQERNTLIDNARNTDVQFNPLFATQVFNELRLRLRQVSELTEVPPEEEGKFDDLADYNYSADVGDMNIKGKYFVPFPLPKYTSFVSQWMDELDENEDAWVPKQPVLLFSFLMDENNAGVVLPKLAPVLATMRSKFKTLTENQYEPINMSKVKRKGPWRDTDIANVVQDNTQGLTLSDSGNALLTLLIGTIIEMGRNGGPLQKGLKLDTSSFENMFSRAYIYLCTAQEKYLKQKSNRLLGNPYTFSEWSLEDPDLPRFPMIFNKVPQSLANLNIRKNNKRPECSACQKGYETFYGNTWLRGKSTREPVKLDKDGNYVSGGNSEAQCIQQLDDLLKTAGVKKDSTNPWYIDFVGTWQQAQTRLDDFKKKQQELYDIGDPRYDWVDYYYKWILLKVDVAIKKFADISDAEEGQQALIGEALDALDDGGGILSTLKTWAGKLANLGAFSAVIAYKIISLILVSPMTQELVIQFCNHIKESICQRIAIANGKEVLIRSYKTSPAEGNKMVYEEWNEGTGEWLRANGAEKKKYAKAAADKRTEWWKNMAFRFFDVISSGTMLNGWVKTIAEMGTMAFGAVGQGISYLISKLGEIPIIGGVISAVGGTGAITPVVIAYLQKEAKGSWNEMVTLNRRFTQLKKLYQAMFSGWSDCLTLMDKEDPESGLLIVKDGGTLGQTTYYKTAYYHAQFNIPYYAILVLNELAYREQNRRRNKPADIDAIIETLIRTEFVAGSKAQRKLAKKARENQKKMEELREKFKSMTREEIDAILQEKIDADKAWEEKKQWLGYAALSAAALAASGGISGIAQAAGAAAGVAKGAAAAVGGAATAKKAVDFVKGYPEETAMMGGLFGMGSYRIFQNFKHAQDKQAIVEVYKTLEQAGVRKMLFHTKLRDKIQEFRLKKGKAEDIEKPREEITKREKFEILMKNKSGFYVYEWAKKSYINYEVATKFFMKYGSPHVDISEERSYAPNYNKTPFTPELRSLPRLRF